MFNSTLMEHSRPYPLCPGAGKRWQLWQGEGKTEWVNIYFRMSTKLWKNSNSCIFSFFRAILRKRNITLSTKFTFFQPMFTAFTGGLDCHDLQNTTSLFRSFRVSKAVVRPSDTAIGNSYRFWGGADTGGEGRFPRWSHNSSWVLVPLCTSKRAIVVLSFHFIQIIKF